jgi:hypothetical protein
MNEIQMIKKELQITKYKLQTNYKLQITNIRGVPRTYFRLSIVNEASTLDLLGIPNYNVRNYKQKTKGSHGLHQGSFKLQTMTALIKSFCGGVQGGQFFQKAPPLAAGGQNG